MATLKDIAQRTGLSPSTISYVLNGKKKVKAETYDKIMAAVDELSYRPNQVARSLKTHRTMTLGVIVPDIANEFFPEIVKGATDKAREMGYNIILCSTGNDNRHEKECVETLLSKDVDGLIFIGAAGSKSLLNQKIEIPVLLVDRRPDMKYPSVTTDNFKGGFLATEHLIKCGCRKIVLLGSSTSINTVSERIRGYGEALKEAGIPYSKRCVTRCEFTISGGYSAVENLLKNNIQFDGIFATNDLIAVGAMRCLGEHKIAVPDDVALIGYDDISVASVITPSLSTIRQPKYLMGKKAAEELIRRINREPLEMEHIVLSPALVKRESTR